MENIDLLQSLFDHKVIRIINVLLQNKDKEFYLRELSKESTVSLATTYRIVQKLVELKVIKRIKVSRFKVYQIEDNEHATFLASIIKGRKKALQEFIDKAKLIKGVNVIILHGEESETKANILLIGEEIDPEKIKTVVNEIKDKHEFTISYFALTPVQYEQMSSIGLLQRQKRMLYDIERQV